MGRIVVFNFRKTMGWIMVYRSRPSNNGKFIVERDELQNHILVLQQNHSGSGSAAEPHSSSATEPAEPDSGSSAAALQLQNHSGKMVL
ncbi:uncharacterized protein G2W53_001269 [Senna tora]|uniref:Uncharacterized protein n=1 Tax=Senna tora TaxID=362788 RepID=A0A835CJ95_9FABA|nr:uncharacterized protein G2W53_001269 [Senna tora]